jgi:hypothetical protein
LAERERYSAACAEYWLYGARNWAEVQSNRVACAGNCVGGAA